MKPNTKRHGGLGTLVTIAYRNIWRNSRRTMLCIIAVAVAVFFNIMMMGFIGGMVNGIEEVVRTYDTGHIQIVSEDYEAENEYLPVQYPPAEDRMLDDVIAELSRIETVTSVLPRISTYATLFDSTIKHAQLWGVDMERELAVNIFNLVDRDDGLIAGHFPSSDGNECAIGSEFARKAGLELGDPLPFKTVSAQFSDKYWSPVVVGIYEFDYQRFDEEVIIVPFKRLQRILGLENKTQQLVIYTENPDNTRSVRDKAAELLGEGHVVREWADSYWVAYLRQMNGLYVIIFAVFQIVASFLIINTILMVIHERIKEIGMMGALGMKRREIVTVFFSEAVFLSLFGALAGVLSGGLATWLGSLFPVDLNAMTGGGMKEMPISGTLFLDFSFEYLIQGFLFGVIVSSLCTLIPSMKSAFVEPVEALRR